MDITDSLAPTSDQLDAVDLLAGPRTFTVDKVSKGNVEQPVNVHLREFPRVWRPGKSMRRVLAACWGSDASQWTGRRVTLYCDETVQFGGKAVGGTRISHLSHLDKPKSVPLLVTRGKSAMFTVQPLKGDAPQQPDDTATLTAAIAAEGIEPAQMPAFLAAASEKQLGRRVGHPSELTAGDRGDLLDNLPALAADFLAEVARQGEGAES